MIGVDNCHAICWGWALHYFTCTGCMNNAGAPARPSLCQIPRTTACRRRREHAVTTLCYVQHYYSTASSTGTAMQSCMSPLPTVIRRARPNQYVRSFDLSSHACKNPAPYAMHHDPVIRRKRPTSRAPWIIRWMPPLRRSGALACAASCAWPRRLACDWSSSLAVARTRPLTPGARRSICMHPRRAAWPFSTCTIGRFLSKFSKEFNRGRSLLRY
jgi:hypothetical protein